MIYEVILSTLRPDGSPHWAPMGLREEGSFYVLRPFKTSHTYKFLLKHPYAVANIADDILPFCMSALGDPSFDCIPARHIKGFVYVDVCAWMELEAIEEKNGEEASSFICSLVYRGMGRPFRGYNRARGLIMELLIAATRYQFYTEGFFEKLISEAKVLTEKTGGEGERKAICIIEEYLKGVFS